MSMISHKPEAAPTSTPMNLTDSELGRRGEQGALNWTALSCRANFGHGIKPIGAESKAYHSYAIQGAQPTGPSRSAAKRGSPSLNESGTTINKQHKRTMVNLCSIDPDSVQEAMHGLAPHGMVQVPMSFEKSFSRSKRTNPMSTCDFSTPLTRNLNPPTKHARRASDVGSIFSSKSALAEESENLSRHKENKFLNPDELSEIEWLKACVIQDDGHSLSEIIGNLKRYDSSRVSKANYSLAATSSGEIEVEKQSASSQLERLLRARNALGLDGLSLAARSENLACIKLLLDNGADIESKDPLVGRTALMWAVHGEKLDAAKFLLEKGANAKIVSRDGMSPLLVCARFGRLAMLELLLENGADPSLCDETGLNALHFAASFGHANLVKRILSASQAEKIVDCTDEKRGLTPFMLAARAGRTSVVQALIAAGTDITKKCKQKGFTALHYASRAGHTAVIQVILGSVVTESYMEARDNENYTALLHAACTGRNETVSRLLSFGCDSKARGNDGFNAVQLASLEGHWSTVQALRSSVRKAAIKEYKSRSQ